MEYTTQFDQDTGICSVAVTGDVRRPGDSVKLQQLARDFGTDHRCHRFIFDLRGATIVGSTIDVFETGTVPADTNHSQQAQMVALVYTGDLTDHRFLETVAVNRGYNLRVFGHMDEAREWVTSTLPETPA